MDASVFVSYHTERTHVCTHNCFPGEPSLQQCPFDPECVIWCRSFTRLSRPDAYLPVHCNCLFWKH